MNTKVLKISAGMAALLLFVSACTLFPTRGSGHLISETREVSGFDAVVFSGTGEVEIIQDGTESITIETDDDVMEFVETGIRSGTLYVGLEFNGAPSILPTKMRVTLHVITLTGVTASGAWDVRAASLETSKLEALISGTGGISIDLLTAEELVAEVSGSGRMDVAGEVGLQRFSISGSGQYHAGDLLSETAAVTISGSGEATLWVTGSLDVRISGAGRVEYYGQPMISFDESGSGTIKSLGDK